MDNLDFRLQDYYKFHCRNTNDDSLVAAILASAQLIAKSILESQHHTQIAQSDAPKP